MAVRKGGAAGRREMKAKKRTVGFTLLELLVVISIIGLLVALLVPTISRATETVRKAMTRRIIKEVSVGLENYRSDFGEYPPSRPYKSDDPESGAMPSGAARTTPASRGSTRSSKRSPPGIFMSAMITCWFHPDRTAGTDT